MELFRSRANNTLLISNKTAIWRLTLKTLPKRCFRGPDILSHTFLVTTFSTQRWPLKAMWSFRPHMHPCGTWICHGLRHSREWKSTALRPNTPSATITTMMKNVRDRKPVREKLGTLSRSSTAIVNQKWLTLTSFRNLDTRKPIC